MLRILTYHRVDEAHASPHLDPRLISASPQRFEQQVRHLRRRFEVVGPQRVLEAANGGPPLPRRAVWITFDDAYRDFATHAWPILKRAGLPITLFVPTRYPDRPARAFWWDRLHRAVRGTRVERVETSFAPPLPLADERQRADSLRRLHRMVKTARHDEAMARVDEVCELLGEAASEDNGVLGWTELKRLAGEGVSLAAHTRTHAILSRLPAGRIREECLGSRADLRDRTGVDLPVISYPDGGHDERVVRVVREAGFRLGLTTLDGLNDLRNGELLRMRRTNLTPRTNAVLFRVRMLPQFARIDRWRHGNAEARS